jgi:aminoglycoside phosphotransferase (APT) family kinase protein
VPRSELTLAALATVAIPGLDVVDARRPVAGGSEYDVALVIDAQGQHWVIRSPASPAAGAALEAELVLLDALAGFADSGALPFDVPRPAGFVHLPEGGRAVVHAMVPGRPLRLESLRGGPGEAASLGRAIAALHELPLSVVENAGMPAYEADEYRRRRQAEVDEAARTGKVPPALLRRWEERLEDVALWRFRPTLVHGDLTTAHVLVENGAVSGLLDWGHAMVADPADDLAWLLVAAPSDAVESILEAYQLRRTELTDPHLAERAMLAGELALARWLLFGVRSDRADVVEDAVAMLADLDEQTRTPAPVAGPSAGESYVDDETDDDETDGQELVGEEPAPVARSKRELRAALTEPLDAVVHRPPEQRGAEDDASDDRPDGTAGDDGAGDGEDPA